MGPLYRRVGHSEVSASDAFGYSRQNPSPMPFRSHIARSFDFGRWSNVAITALVGATGAAALILWVSGTAGVVLLAPAHAFLSWAILREIDPDHEWPALIGAAGASIWSLTGQPVASAGASLGLLVASRVVVRSTGRRLLGTDIVGLVALGVVIGYTVEGWVAGFGLAVALYIDQRLDGSERLLGMVAASVTAIGVTVVSAALGVFPETTLELRPLLAALAGAGALLMIVRDPADPVSRVDARHRSPMDSDRLHVARSLASLLVVGMVFFTGSASDGLVPLVSLIFLAVARNEVELLMRRSR